LKLDCESRDQRCNLRHWSNTSGVVDLNTPRPPGAAGIERYESTEFKRDTLPIYCGEEQSNIAENASHKEKLQKAVLKRKEAGI